MDDVFDVNEYCTIVALEDGVYFTCLRSDILYCVDGGEWIHLPLGTPSITINKGQFFSLKANFYSEENVSNNANFTINGSCKLTGTIMSLTNNCPGKDSLGLRGGIFRYCFENCDSIVSVSKTFLPETNLKQGCYKGMFQNCSNLIIAPELPATTLDALCYEEMFENCSNLHYIKMLALNITEDHTRLWTRFIANKGVFVKNPNATWEIYGVNGIPTNWRVAMDGDPITFTFSGVEYEFEPGMTWEEFVNSNYNSNAGFSINSYGQVEKKYPIEKNYVAVFSNDIVIPGETYAPHSTGGGRD